ncbi:MAG: DNA primase [Oscillospiraceae bacterium]|nr:DNA primase [Oscillospiraceae bacterium]
MIPAQFIDELVARSELSDVVSSYVSLTRKGDRLWGLCPFHNEKTPSFSVSQEKQVFYCFGCGKGGGVISFIMEIENLPYAEAIRLLAKRAGLTVPEGEENDAFRVQRERVLRLNHEAARYFHDQLSQPGGARGASYLYDTRRLSKGTVTRFGLGVAPDGWDHLIEAMAEKGFDKRDLLDAGLAVDNKKGRIYDRFRDRVMFPIIDLRGDVIGFGGRVLGDEQPKYLNSPDTVIYNKSRNLFALNLARKSKQGRLILTEGYMDTIALHQAGFDCAVASLGTSLTEHHALLLARYTKEVVIAYDGDGAGTSAAQRAIPILERTGVTVRVLALSGAKDPDEYIGKFGRTAFARLLDRSENHIEYRLAQIQKQYDLSDDEQKVTFLRACAEFIATLQSPVEREVFGSRAAEAAGVSRDAMEQEVKRARSTRARREKKKQERKNLTPTVQLQPRDQSMRYQNIRSARAEEGVIRLLLLEPVLTEKVESRLHPEDFSSPLLGKAYSILCNRYRAGMSTQLAVLAGELEGSEISHLAQVLDRPEALEHSEQAMEDYLSLIEWETAKRSDRAQGEPQESLLAAQARFKEKKSFGGTSHE